MKMKLKQIKISVTFSDSVGDLEPVAEVEIPIENIKDLDARKIIESTQRAVSNAIEVLLERFDPSKPQK